MDCGAEERDDEEGGTVIENYLAYCTNPTIVKNSYSFTTFVKSLK